MKCGHVVLYMENKTALFIIESIPHCPSGKRICQNKQNLEMWLHCLIERNGVSIIDSIPHCPSGKRMCQNKANQRNVATLLNRAKLEYLSSIVFHTVLVAREYVKTSKTKKCGYIA